MKSGFLKASVNLQKTVLSSTSVLYKTENFIKQTKYISNVDFFISKLCDAIMLNINNLTSGEEKRPDAINCYSIETLDRNFTFLFKFGYQIDKSLNDMDIVFFDFSTSEKTIRQNDQRLNDYLKTHSSVDVVIKMAKKLTAQENFNKLYLVSVTSGINLPKLSQQQKSIVETIDKNVLVQGVAGSGKTNICIDKIIFSACKNYGGKVLYTTYSRGLLMDTKLKVEAYKKQLENFLYDFGNQNVVFLDENHKKALENKFGIYFSSEDDNEIAEKIKKIIEFLNCKVDYLLIEDIYKSKFGQAEFVGENYFVNTYSKKLNNHQVAKDFSKLSKYSIEVIYKEIYGMILGFYDISKPFEILPLGEYINLRKNSFSNRECEVLYNIAIDYRNHCQKSNLMDNNLASKLLLKDMDESNQYSLCIVDEVQDYSQVNLCLFKKMSLKMFCVGDAQQMINPSYFSFAYLKNLLYEKELTNVVELKNNYRNSKKIEQIVDNLGKINKLEFGTHSFVLKGESVDNGTKTTAVYVQSDDFAKQIAKSGFDNFTFVVSNDKQKNLLKKEIKNQEILTVSEIKGLERNTIVAYNLLSDNADKWQTLQQNKVNHKNADENSVFRYYYNLFYVGISRAQEHLFVVENKNIVQFKDFFKQNFENSDTVGAIKLLSNVVSKIEFTQQEILERIADFVRLEQFDNARFTANKIRDDVTRISELRKIDIYEKYIKSGHYREAGIKFWEYGMIQEAKQQFTLSNDNKLIELVDACSGNGSGELSFDIVNYFGDVKDNQMAQKFIVETLKNDIVNLKHSFSTIKENLKKVANKNGK